jgi:hypothetical protein
MRRAPCQLFFCPAICLVKPEFELRVSPLNCRRLLRLPIIFPAPQFVWSGLNQVGRHNARGRWQFLHQLFSSARNLFGQPSSANKTQPPVDEHRPCAPPSEKTTSEKHRAAKRCFSSRVTRAGTRRVIRRYYCVFQDRFLCTRFIRMQGTTRFGSLVLFPCDSARQTSQELTRHSHKRSLRIPSRSRRP